MCFDGVVLESDYGVTLLSKRFADITETISVDTVSVHKMLEMILEYCKMVKYNSGLMTGFELKDWIAQFLDVDPKTLLDLLTSACYMKVDSLMKLTWTKVDGMIKGKTLEEISEIFGAANFFVVFLYDPVLDELDYCNEVQLMPITDCIRHNS